MSTFWFDEKESINNGLVRHDLETDHNFDFKDSKMSVYIHKITRKLLNLISI